MRTLVRLCCDEEAKILVGISEYKRGGMAAYGVVNMVMSLPFSLPPSSTNICVLSVKLLDKIGIQETHRCQRE